MKTSFDLFLEKNGYTPKYKPGEILVNFHDYNTFRKATKFHKRGLRYTDEIENFFKEYQIDPIEYEDKFENIIFKVKAGKEKETVDKLSKSKYVNFAEQVDNRDLEWGQLEEIGNDLVDFSMDYRDTSDEDIKKKLEDFIHRLTVIRNEL